MPPKKFNYGAKVFDETSSRFYSPVYVRKTDIVKDPRIMLNLAYRAEELPVYEH